MRMRRACRSMCRWTSQDRDIDACQWVDCHLRDRVTTSLGGLGAPWLDTPEDGDAAVAAHAAGPNRPREPPHRP